MKKNSLKAPKLTLSRETVIHLTDLDTKEAIGGAPKPPSGPSVCESWCFTC